MNIEKELKEHGQEHVLDALGRLNGEAREALIRELSSIDWDMLEGKESASVERDIQPISGMGIEELQAKEKEYFEAGKKVIAEGKLVCVLLAGGQGTRLGSDKPKGMYNVGITKYLPIFSILIGNLLAVCNRCGAYVPLAVMTSEKNDRETREFFEANGYFSYPEDYIKFFVQDMAPSVDFSGKLLFESEGKLVRSPNGNGGWYSSLCRSGILKEAHFDRAEWFNVFSVDNVLQRIADPVFLGATVKSGCATGAKVVKKACPEERVGVLCLSGGKPCVVEYYELSSEKANLRDGNGELRFRYGVTLNYLLSAQRLKEIAGMGIPVHTVKKKIPYWNGSETVAPDKENGYKFETLILDLIELMGSCLPCEIVREKEFAPVKNREGVDSVDTARALLVKNGVEL